MLQWFQLYQNETEVDYKIIEETASKCQDVPAKSRSEGLQGLARVNATLGEQRGKRAKE